MPFVHRKFCPSCYFCGHYGAQIQKPPFKSENAHNITASNSQSFTYDHRLKRIGHPVRSAIHKLQIGGLVVGWVTTSESSLSYVYVSLFFFSHSIDFQISLIHLLLSFNGEG